MPGTTTMVPPLAMTAQDNALLANNSNDATCASTSSTTRSSMSTRTRAKKTHSMLSSASTSTTNSTKSRMKKSSSASAVMNDKTRASIKFHASNFVTRKRNTLLEQNYLMKEKVGEGGYGEVFHVVYKPTGAERAVKVIRKDKCDKKDDEALHHEFAVVKDLDHPNILKQFEMMEDDKNYYIVTDLYKGGELLDELEAIGCFEEADAAQLMNHVLSCINYCHSKGVVHRDLKPENILLEQNMKLDGIKIIDFGLARQYPPGTHATFTDFAGTSYYLAPQIVLEEPYTCKCDVWTCGVIAYIVLAGYAPFDGEDLEEIVEEIIKGEFDFEDEEVWDSVSEEAKDFIEYLLTYEEEDRPTALEALNHPWLQQHRSEVQEEHRQCPKRSSSTKVALANMQNFNANSKLKQATYALLASQMILKEQKEEIDEVFRILDVNCSGKLTKEDMKQAYFEFYQMPITDQQVDDIFEKVNFSGSGAIEYSEFVVASLMEKDLIDDDKLRAAFMEFDLDGNGFIDQEELKEVLVVDDDMDDYVLNKIIKQVDTDGDGMISYEEFKSMMLITASQPNLELKQSWSKQQSSDRELMSDHSNLSLMGDDTETSFSTRTVDNESIDKLRSMGNRASFVMDGLFRSTSQCSLPHLRRCGTGGSIPNSQRRTMSIGGLGGFESGLDEMGNDLTDCAIDEGDEEDDSEQFSGMPTPAITQDTLVELGNDLTEVALTEEDEEEDSEQFQAQP